MIIIDIDNTVTNQIDRLRKNYDLNLEVMLAKSTTEQELMRDLLFPNAMEVISELAQKFDIIWLSARSTLLYEITLTWIIENKLPCKQLILVDKLEDKFPILIKLKPTLFIDDLQFDLYSLNPKPATRFRDKLTKAKIPFLVFDSNWLDVKKKLKAIGLLDN
jgi:hypothetical protein